MTLSKNSRDALAQPRETLGKPHYSSLLNRARGRSYVVTPTAAETEAVAQTHTDYQDLDSAPALFAFLTDHGGAVPVRRVKDDNGLAFYATPEGDVIHFISSDTPRKESNTFFDKHLRGIKTYAATAMAALQLFGATAAYAGQPRVDKVENAASGGSKFAPGTHITIRGKDLAAGDVLADDMIIPTTYTSDTQVNALLPEGMNVGPAYIRIKNGTLSNPMRIELQERAPEFFKVPRYGDKQGGFAAIQRAELVTPPPPSGEAPFVKYTLVDVKTPARNGDTLVGYLTGMGSPSEAPSSMSQALRRLFMPVLAGWLSSAGGNKAGEMPLPSVFFNGQAGEVLYAGPVSGFSGLYQVNMRMPEIPTASIQNVQICYEIPTACSMPVEMPAVRDDTKPYAAFWLQNPDGLQVEGFPVLINDRPAGATSRSGAYLGELPSGPVKFAIDGGTIYYNWRETDWEKAGFSAKPRLNVPVAVSLRNEPVPSGDVPLLPRKEATNIRWSYTKGPARGGGLRAEDYWEQIGRSMTLLELMQWQADDICGESKIYRYRDQDLPVLYWFAPGGRPEITADVRQGLQALNTDRVYFRETSIDPTSTGKGLIIRFMPPPNSNAIEQVVTDTAEPCIAPRLQTMYMDPRIVQRAKAIAKHGGLHALGFLRHPPSSGKMNLEVYIPVDDLDLIEEYLKKRFAFFTDWFVYEKIRRLILPAKNVY